MRGATSCNGVTGEKHREDIRECVYQSLQSSVTHPASDGKLQSRLKHIDYSWFRIAKLKHE